MPEKLKLVKKTQQPEAKPAAKTEGWWQTVPGMLTATAGIITAVGGLLVVLNQVGMLGGKQTPAAQPLPTPVSQSSQSPNRSESTVTVPNNSQNMVTFPSGTEVKFRNNRGQGTYKVLTAQVETRSTGKLSLKLTVRMSNNGPADVGFYTDSFRLVIDGVPRAPVNFLNEIVDARSAKEGDVEFEMPSSAGTLALQVLVGDKSETLDLPIALKSSAK